MTPLLAAVETSRLRGLPDSPGLRQLLSELGAGPDWQEELARWLREERSDWEHFPEPENERQRSWLLVARLAPEHHQLLAQALAGRPQELEELLGEGPDGEEDWWQELRDLPILESSRRLRARLAEGWQPRRRWTLFARLRALVAPGELRAVRQDWRTLAPDGLHWFRLAGERILACGKDGALHVYDLNGQRLLHRHFKREMRWGKVWEVGSALLVYDGRNLTMIEENGQLRWEQPCDGAVACQGGRVAVLESGQLRLFDVAEGRQILTQANPQQPPPPQTGPLFLLMDHTVQQLAWSADGRWLASSHQAKVFLWEAETAHPVRCWEHQASVSWLGFLQGSLAVALSDTLGNAWMVGLSHTFFLYDPESSDNLYTAKDLQAVASVQVDLPWIGLGCNARVFWLHWQQDVRECGPREGKGLALDCVFEGTMVVHTEEPVAELVDLERGEVFGRWPGYSHVQLCPFGALALRRGQLQTTPLWDETPVARLGELPGASARAYVEALQA